MKPRILAWVVLIFLSASVAWSETDRGQKDLPIESPPPGLQPVWRIYRPVKYLKIEPYNIHVLGTATVSDWMMRESHLLITNMVAALTRAEDREKLAGHQAFLITDADPALPGTTGQRNGGGKGRSLFNEELVCREAVDTIRPTLAPAYRGWNTPVHEFGHSIEFALGLQARSDALFSKHVKNYNPKVAREYFAWAVEAWFESASHSKGRGAMPKWQYDYLATVFSAANTWKPDNTPRAGRDGGSRQGNLAAGATLLELAAQGPLTLFTARKGAVMPNGSDQTNNLGEGDKALLLSGKSLTDLRGLSTLRVVDEGKERPIGEVRRLHLFFNHNQIQSIPDEIAALKNVVFLYFENNQLSALPRALMQMDSLEGMYFTANRFTEIPPFVFDMTRLKKLQFSKNRIRVLPPAIGQLTELRHFNMSNNQIETIPDSIANLTRLRVCDLSDNRIAALPEAFGRVQIVNQLRVRNNPLASLPAGFATMRATIDITGTKIDPAKLSPELRARISTEKPPGSKEPDKIIVAKPEKEKKR